MRRVPGLSVVFPAYNDGATIAGLVTRAAAAAGELSDDYEIIVVNDGSTDDTQQVLDELCARQPRLRVVRHQQNRGYGGALRSGFREAKLPLIFYTDGDAQYDPAEMKDLFRHLEDGVHLVQGFKLSRHDPPLRIVAGRLYRSLVRAAFRLRVRDVDCDFRLMRREVLERIELRRDSGAICVEMIRKTQDAGFHIVEVPVHHHPRLHGRSQFFRPRHIARTLFDLADLWRELRTGSR